MRILFIGDIYGSPGRHLVEKELPRLLAEERIDFTIANGENCAAGYGINRKIFEELTDLGVDCLTMGNHVWGTRDIFNFIDHPRLVRPANLPPGNPGSGWRQFEVNGRKLIVCNLLGRTFMSDCDCPFQTMDRLLKEWAAEDACIFVDFHAEATSEKVAMGWYLDGRISALCGSHTHVQTNDARILPRGTGYLSDAGMTGPRDSVLGVMRETIIQRFLTGYSPRFEPAQGDLQFNGLLLELDEAGRTSQLELCNFWRPSL